MSKMNDKMNKVMGYINNGNVVYDITINADDDKNYKTIIKFVVNDRWFRDATIVKTSTKESGGVDYMIMNSAQLGAFGGVNGLVNGTMGVMMNNSNLWNSLKLVA